MVQRIESSGWSVQVSLPKDEGKGRRWRQNVQRTCVCASAARAIEMVMSEHPDATVHSVNRISHQSVMLLDDPVTVVLIDGAA
jgi:alpha-D-ribose 1-methylphosphonate 5-triphosphate diphosphatase PhnM